MTSQPSRHNSKIRLCIVDDHEIFRKGLEKLLRTIPDFDIAASFSSGLDLLEQLPELVIDLMVLDVQLPDISEEELLIRIKASRPDIPILYLTMMRGNRLFRKLEKHGIGGYIIKDAPLDELCNAIRKVANNQTYISQEIDLNSDVIVNSATTPKNRLSEILSPREWEVLKLICQEYSSSEIAQKLFVSTSTVDTHRKKLLVKLGVSNTVGLVKYAITHGILEEL